MELDLERLKTNLCRSLCAEVSLFTRSDNRISISTPFSFSDGDSFLLMAEPLPTGGIRITDCGNTLMHLSYSMNVDEILKPGNRNDLFRRVIAEYSLTNDEGELYIDSPADEAGKAVFKFGQALSQIHDIGFLSRSRISSTFYEDLGRVVHEVAPQALIKRDYVVESKSNAEDYPIDYRLDFPGSGRPLFLFGIPSNEKAKLATVIIQHWLAEEIRFTSFLVFQDQSKISRSDVARLTNVGDESISSLGAVSDMRRKLERLYNNDTLSQTGGQ
jgi:hypothetical protein